MGPIILRFPFAFIMGLKTGLAISLVKSITLGKLNLKNISHYEIIGLMCTMELRQFDSYVSIPQVMGTN